MRPSTLAFIVSMFDSGQMTHDHRVPDRDRLLIARLDGIARRHARWGGLTDAEKAAGVTELHGVAGDRCDLLAEVAGWQSARLRARARSIRPGGRRSRNCAGWLVPTSR